MSEIIDFFKFKSNKIVKSLLDEQKKYVKICSPHTYIDGDIPFSGYNKIEYFLDEQCIIPADIYTLPAGTIIYIKRTPYV